MRYAAVLLSLALSSQQACTVDRQRATARDAGAKGNGSASAAAESATPVAVASVVKTDLERVVSGPGQTAALEQQRIVAPYVARLLSLNVADGDKVVTGQVVGTLLSENSEAALIGAQAMERSARTERERADARRAVELAQRSAVKTKLRVPESGIVVSHGADEGSLVAADETLVTIAALDSIAFVAQIVQSEIGAVRAGQDVRIELAGTPQPLAGRVHAILPTGSAANLSSPVRIDLVGRPAVQVGIFGTAQIVVDVQRGALAVPHAALLRNDISGVSRIALLKPSGTIDWVDVKTGLEQRGLVQIVEPVLREGEQVVTSGQVGLQQGAHVTVSQ